MHLEGDDHEAKGGSVQIYRVFGGMFVGGDGKSRGGWAGDSV